MRDRLGAALSGRYRIERELGEGGMATVFLAEDMKHKRQVAIKVLKPELAAVVGAERFLAEIEITAGLQHPHILPLFDSGEADGLVWYAMPYVQGESLREKLDRETQLPVEEALSVAKGVGEALQYAHEQGVVHRDVKPANILMHRGEPLVADFGIALAVQEAGGGRLTGTGLSLGTPHYMSPEQASGERAVDERSDVWALGCLLYEMLTGEPPYTGPTAQAVLAGILTGAPAAPTGKRSSVPVHVEHAILTALETVPADRFRSVSGFLAALDDPSYRRAGAVPARSESASRWRAAALVLGLVILGLAGLLLRPEPDPPVERQHVVLFDSLASPGPVAVRYGLALAPDGSAMVNTRRQGSLRLKRRGETRWTPIPGAEDGVAPFFSPEGDWIGFVDYESRTLRKVPRRGGSSITLADSLPSPLAPAAWLDDGTIVYAGPGWGLYRVTTEGESLGRIATSRDLGGSVLHLAPLPDARGVLYSVCDVGGCGVTSVGAVDLASGTPTVLVKGGQWGWYVPELGHLLYAGPEGGVFAAPFDPGELEITGPEIPVLDGVLATPQHPPLQLGADGTLIYLEGDRSVAQRNRIVWVDREGRSTPVDPGWTGEFGSLALSPDGRLLAFTDMSEQTSVHVKELPDGPVTRLTPEGPFFRRPAWTPDGRRVAYQAADTTRGGAEGTRRQVFDIRRADASTGARRFIDLDDVHQVAFSRGGRHVVYRLGDNPNGDLRYMAIDGADTTHHDLFVRNDTHETSPVLSPDGRWVAYMSDVSGEEEVYVRPFPDALGGRTKVSEGGGFEPLWSPTGDELFYLDGDGILVAAAVQADSSLFRIVEREPLFQRSGRFAVAGSEHRYDVAPDGRFVMVAFTAYGTESGEETEPRLILVENWFTELKALLEGG